MTVVIKNMIIKILNVNHSHEEALKLLRSFINMVARNTLKLDPVLVEEIIVTLIDGFPEFINITPTIIPIPEDGNRARAFLRYFGQIALDLEYVQQQVCKHARELSQQRIQTLQSRSQSS
nr:protein zds1-like [Ipomoea batatas]